MWLSVYQVVSVCDIAGRSAESASGAEDGTSTLNVLLVGSGDLRHVLTTMASTSRQIHVSTSKYE